MHNKAFVSIIGGIALSLVSLSATAITYTSITVFGDSLSDGGNDYIFTGGTFPPSPPYAQRFTNGLTAVEKLANRLGLPLTPSESGGSNYAYGGAESGTGNFLSVRPDLPPALQAVFSNNDTGALYQVQSFAAAPPVGFGGPESLVVLWAGANDLFTALTTDPVGFAGDPVGTVIAPAMANLAAEVGLLYGVGARSILMPNLPNIGVTPFGAAVGAAGMTAFSALFNVFLDQTIAGLESTYAGLNIMEVDTYSRLTAIVANPGDYGFTIATTPCVNQSTFVPCTTPNDYVFWDTVHPTTAVYNLLAQDFYNAVPEPSVILLFAVGMAGLAVSRRRPAGL